MLKFEVFDGTSTAELVLWDKECVQILQKKASELDCAQVVANVMIFYTLFVHISY